MQAWSLASCQTTIDDWFHILSDTCDYDPISTNFHLESDYKDREEYIVKSSFLFDMLNGSLILQGKTPCLQPFQIIEEDGSVKNFQDYINRIKFIQYKVFDVPYKDTVFKDFLNGGRLDLALVYLSNFDHYCRYFLYVLSKSEVDFISLYKLKESLDDRIDYYVKLFKPSDRSKKNFKKELENIIYQQDNKPAILNSFTKFANKHVYIGQIARHGLKLSGNPGALTEAEKQMSPKTVIESASKVIFSAIIMSLTKLSFMEDENLAKIEGYEEEEFIFEEEVSDIDLSDFLF